MAIKTQEVLTKVYVTDDGQEFTYEWDAIRHDCELKRERGERLDDYVFDNSIWTEADGWQGLAGYLGGDCASVFLVEVDDAVIEWAGMKETQDDDIEDIEKSKGQKAFFTLGQDGTTLWFMGTLKEVADRMAADLDRLNEWSKQKGGAR